MKNVPDGSHGDTPCAATLPLNPCLPGGPLSCPGVRARNGVPFFLNDDFGDERVNESELDFAF